MNITMRNEIMAFEYLCETVTEHAWMTKEDLLAYDVSFASAACPLVIAATANDFTLTS